MLTMIIVYNIVMRSVMINLNLVEIIEKKISMDPFMPTLEAMTQPPLNTSHVNETYLNPNKDEICSKL